MRFSFLWWLSIVKAPNVSRELCNGSLVINVMIFQLPALTWRKQVQSFPLLLRTLLSHKYFVY